MYIVFIFKSGLLVILGTVEHCYVMFSVSLEGLCQVKENNNVIVTSGVIQLSKTNLNKICKDIMVSQTGGVAFERCSAEQHRFYRYSAFSA